MRSEIGEERFDWPVQKWADKFDYDGADATRAFGDKSRNPRCPTRRVVNPALTAIIQAIVALKD